VSDSFVFSPFEDKNPSGLRSRETRETVSNHDFDLIARYSVPMVNYINKLQPHVVIGCDRGARLTTLAARQMWKELMPETPFPTLDGGVSFAKISASDIKWHPYVYRHMRERVGEIISNSIEIGKEHGRVLDENEPLKVLFIDDWALKGRVSKLVHRLAEDLGFEVHLAVMENRSDDESIVSSNYLGRDETKFEDIFPLSESDNVGASYDREYRAAPPRRNNVLQTRKKLGAAVHRVAQHVSLDQGLQSE